MRRIASHKVKCPQADSGRPGDTPHLMGMGLHFVEEEASERRPCRDELAFRRALRSLGSQDFGPPPYAMTSSCSCVNRQRRVPLK